MYRALLAGLVAAPLALAVVPAAAAPPAPVGHRPLPGAAACQKLPAARQPLPWEPGERLAYDIDMVGAQAGKLALVALPIVGKGKAAEHPLRALAASNSFFSKVRRVRGRATSYVRASDMHPRRYEEQTEEGQISKKADVVFRGAGEGRKVEIDYVRNTARRKSAERYLHEAFDPVSAVYYLRTLDLQPGMPICFDAYAIRKLWRVVGQVKGVETVRVPAGVMQAWHLEGRAIRVDDPTRVREVHLWISNDERRLPVAALGVIDLGPVRAQLTWVGDGKDGTSEESLIREASVPAEEPPAEGKAKGATEAALLERQQTRRGRAEPAVPTLH